MKTRDARLTFEGSDSVSLGVYDQLIEVWHKRRIELNGMMQESTVMMVTIGSSK